MRERPDMAALEAARIPTDLEGVAQLQGQPVQGLRHFECNLRLTLGASTAEQLFLSERRMGRRRTLSEGRRIFFHLSPDSPRTCGIP